MYGKEETVRGSNRRYQADAGGSQGSTGQKPKEGSQEQNQSKGPHEQGLVRDAKTREAQAPEEAKTRKGYSERITEAQSEQAAQLAKACGFKTNTIARPQHPTREPKNSQD